MKTNERLRNGVLFYTKGDPNAVSIINNGNPLTVSNYPDSVFYVKRSNHQKRNTTNDCKIVHGKVTPAAGVTPMVTSSKKEKQVMVKFQYPSKDNAVLEYRYVVLLSLDATYLIGLETNKSSDKAKYQFKKYLRSKIPYNGIILSSYGE